ncbi:MAG: hypothetical protein ACO3JL_00155 [Myxococcota bacterium]
MWSQGCGVGQSDACQRYVACQRATDDAFRLSPGTDTADFEEPGQCWRGSIEQADRCTALCEDARAALAAAAAELGVDLASCAPPAT